MNYELIGVVLDAPSERVTKGSEGRAPARVRNFRVAERTADAEGLLRDSGRVVDVGDFYLGVVVPRPGDLVRLTTGPIEARPWSKDGRSLEFFRASLRREGLEILDAAADQPALI